MRLHACSYEVFVIFHFLELMKTLLGGFQGAALRLKAYPSIKFARVCCIIRPDEYGAGPRSVAARIDRARCMPAVCLTRFAQCAHVCACRRVLRSLQWCVYQFCVIKPTIGLLIAILEITGYYVTGTISGLSLALSIIKATSLTISARSELVRDRSRAGLHADRSWRARGATKVDCV